MTEYNRRATDKADYARIIKIFRSNQALFNRISSRTGFKKEDIIGAAILHFSTLSLQKQLEIVSEYLKHK